MTVLGDLINVVSGFAFKSSLFTEEGDLPLIRIRDVKRGFSETYYAGEYSDEYLIDNGDLLVGMDGEFNAKRWSGGRALLNQRVCKIVATSSELDEQYLYYFLPKQLKLIEDATPSVTVKHLSVKTIKNIEIPLPPLEEQKRIAAILDKADAIRRKRQQAIDLTDQLLRSVFLDMFGDPKVDWETVSFIEVAKPEKNTFVNGPFGSNLLTSELKDEGVPVLYIQDIRSGRYNRRSNKHVTELKAKELSSCNVFPGDVLIAKVGDPPGAAAVYPKDEPNAIITQDVVRIRPDLKRVTPEFVAGFLNSSIGERWLAPIIVEATRSRFGLGGIKKKTFVMPPTSLQHKYSEIHKQIESERRRMLLGLKNSQNLFNSMAKNVFKGQLNKPTKTA
ncbi:MAG: restriction endonuclease subunit S [Nitrosomonas sp.]|nr:restriction endonuclease subunit S [Nitrosomonas sp.]